MGRWIIVRHGSNAANQSRIPRLVLGTVAADSAESAKAAAGRRWTCYNGQHFEAISLAGRTRKADRKAAAEMDAMQAAVGGDWLE